MTHRAAEGAEAEGEEGEGVAQPMARRRAEGEEGEGVAQPMARRLPQCSACSSMVFFYKVFMCRVLQAGRPKKRFLFGHLFLNIPNVFCAKKRVGHDCILSMPQDGH